MRAAVISWDRERLALKLFWPVTPYTIHPASKTGNYPSVTPPRNTSKRMVLLCTYTMYPLHKDGSLCGSGTQLSTSQLCPTNLVVPQNFFFPVNFFELCCRNIVVNVKWFVCRVIKMWLKFSIIFSPDIISSGWLGSKHQPTELYIMYISHGGWHENCMSRSAKLIQIFGHTNNIQRQCPRPLVIHPFLLS